MSIAKLQPPRKLTDEEDLDSFEDWWFQVISYFSKDPNFKGILDNPTYSWQDTSVQFRGCSSAEACSNLTSLLRSMATYAAGPYIKDIIVKHTTSVADVKREFMKFLEIELSDLTFLDYYQIQRKPSERPLRFYHRLRHHQMQHLLPNGAFFQGSALKDDEKWSPTLERLTIMEWLRRMDPRLIPFVKEKFSTELSGSSSHLTTLVETLSKNVDHYITWMNQNQSFASTNAVSPHDLSHHQETLSPEVADINFQQSYRGRGFGRGLPRGRSGGRAQGYRGRGGDYRPGRIADCEYCYVQSRVHGKSVDYRHNVKNCPTLRAMFRTSPINAIAEDFMEEQVHPYDMVYPELENKFSTQEDGGHGDESQ